MKHSPLFLLCAAFLAVVVSARAAEWQTLFDGRSLAGWKASEHPGSVKVIDGLIACDGPRSHLFYVGADGQAEFENFELELEIKAAPGANSGVYFQTKWQDEGWPKAGFESQVNNTQPTFEHNYIENKKTGSLYGVRNIYKALVKDGEWFTMNVIVRRPRVEIRLNGTLVTDYIEPANPKLPSGGPQLNLLGKGTIALQCHDEKSQVWYRSVKIRPLPPGEDASVTKPVFEQQDLVRLALGKDNFPLVDLHTQLGAGLSLEQVLTLRQQRGISAGLIAEGGQLTDAAAEAFVQKIAPTPCLAGLRVQDREALHRLSPAAQARFDYIIAAAPNAATSGEFVAAAVRLMESEPIDIIETSAIPPMNPEQSAQLIAAAAKNGVAFEISTLQPGLNSGFIARAKAAGVRFVLGSRDATAANWADWSNALAVVAEAKLAWRDMYMPRHAPSRAQKALAAR